MARFEADIIHQCIRIINKLCLYLHIQITKINIDDEERLSKQNQSGVGRKKERTNDWLDNLSALLLRFQSGAPTLVSVE